MILLIVVALLALFAALALSFVYYAEAAAAGAGIAGESLQQRQPDVDPQLLLDYFLRQLLYDLPDDESGVYSALRGHSLARNLYGASGGPAADITPYNGVGRLDGPSPFGAIVPGPDISDRHLINYTYYRDDPLQPPALRFLRDPERPGWRAGPAAPRAPFVGGANTTYTYPDLNAVFLAAVRADGTVLRQSYYRPWTAAPADGAFFDAGTGQLNPLWSAEPGAVPAWFQYTTLRPLPALNPGFPPPEDGGGDVKNLMGPGTLRRVAGGKAEYWNNDSFWIDLDFPVLTAVDGRRYKPLFAPLIVDLDNRINVNVAATATGLGLPPSHGGFRLGDMEALLRHGDTSSLGAASELFRRFPGPFADARIRGMLTCASVDLGVPGAAPWIHDPAAFPYEAPPTIDPDYPESPIGPAIGHFAPGPIAYPGDPRQANGDYGPLDGRGLSAALGRVDLHRPLPPYPHQGSGAAPPYGPPLTVRAGRPVLDVPFDVDAPNGPVWRQFLLAHTARQQLAEDIYRRLLAVAGVAPILPNQNPMAPPAELLDTRRWLAQLAVNIVDFIDEDDVSTPLLFYTAADYAHLPMPPPLPPDPDRVSRPDCASLPGRVFQADLQWPMYWVFGTELPRVLVNEALAEIGTNDPDRAYADLVRVFVELHNPPVRPDRRPVPLRMGSGAGGYAPYRLLLGVKSPVPLHPAGAAILPGAANDNVLGNPEPSAVRQATTDDDFTAAGGAALGVPPGFYLLGAPASSAPAFALADPLAVGTPPITPILRTGACEYARTFTVRQPNDPPDERQAGIAVMLRRLANPYLPFDGRRRVPGSAARNLMYNPFITVDYVDSIPLSAVAAPPGAAGVIASTGKLQPYAAYRALLQRQTGPQHPAVQCTFGGPNFPAPPQYAPLLHLDRRPASPLELLGVSGYQPYQLTQRFIGPGARGTLVPFAHRAPWLDDGQLPGGPSHRLYRLFEFIETRPPVNGGHPLGRPAGKVNLNTVWEPEILCALCSPANSMEAAVVDDLFRSGCYDATGSTVNLLRRTAGLVPGKYDLPFQSLAAGSYPAGTPGALPRGVDATYLRLRTMGSASSPDMVTALLTRIAGQVTTRSNLFAVWLTVGFFEVSDTTTRPARLGAEVGRAQGRQIRHRMFAIVDRSNLSIASCVTALRQAVQAAPYPLPLAPQTVAVDALHGTLAVPGRDEGVAWTIEPGTLLVIDTGSAQETVAVLGVNPAGRVPTIAAVFAKPHAAGAAISLAHVAGAPPVFLSPLATYGIAPPEAPPNVPPTPYTLTMRLAVDPARSSGAMLAGRADTVPWTIEPGARLIIDVGPNQEAVTVERAGFAFDRASATGSFQVVARRPHAPGLLITNTLLGNPGPQMRFGPRHPAYGAVVRYASVIR